MCRWSVRYFVMSKGRWENYGLEWPPGERPCTTCREMLSFSQFHKHASCLHGVNTVCKACRKPLSKGQWRKLPVEKRLWQQAKSRSKKLSREFTIVESDIRIPEVCPVFHVPFSNVPRSPYAPSIDRLDSKRGYTPDNIIIMTVRANLLKNDGTIREFEALLTFLKLKNGT